MKLDIVETVYDTIVVVSCCSAVRGEIGSGVRC
jgi:hypothetical protein